MRKTATTIIVALTLVIISELSACSEFVNRGLPAPAGTFTEPVISNIAQLTTVLPSEPALKPADLFQPETAPVLPEVKGELEILNHRIVTVGDATVILGTARNSGASDLKYAEVVANFYDVNGKTLVVFCEDCGTHSTVLWRDVKIDGLNEGESWDFEIMFVDKFLYKDPTIITGYDISVGIVR
jgi:hypothetical protein